MMINMNKKISQDYIRSLEETIKKFLEPIKNIPFSVCIKSLFGHEVISFDLTLEENKTLLESLVRAAKLAGENAFKEGIFTRRPNEAGNQMEPFVLDALRNIGLKAEKPVSKSGRIKTAGYPDIEIVDMFGRTIYLDCKTYNSKTKDQSFRTFYFSPSQDPKITKDAFHILISFELTTGERKGRSAFIPISWQIYTLEKLKVQIKHEFNASNRELYRREALLAEGIISEY